MTRVWILYSILLAAVLLRFFWFTHIMPPQIYALQEEGEHIVQFCRSLEEGASIQITEDRLLLFSYAGVSSCYEIDSDFTLSPTGKFIFHRETVHFDIIGDDARGSLFYSLLKRDLDFIASGKRRYRY